MTEQRRDRRRGVELVAGSADHPSSVSHLHLFSRPCPAPYLSPCPTPKPSASRSRPSRGAKLRAFFTLLGIIVSVAFLVTVVAVIQGMNVYVKENLTGAIIGTNAFQVRRTPIIVGLLDDDQIKRIAERPLISTEDAEVVAARAPRRAGGRDPVGVADAVNAVVYRGNQSVGGVLIFGRDPGLPAGAGLRRSPPASRSTTSTSRRRRLVTVIG